MSQDALDLLNQLTARAEMEAVEDAVAWVVMLTDTETEQLHFYGPFPGPAEAAFYAGVIEEGTNRGAAEGEAPFVATVYPVLAPA